MMLWTSSVSPASADITLPADVQECYGEAYSALMEGDLTEETVAQYVSPEWVRIAYSRQGLADASDDSIIKSAYNFALDVRARVEQALAEKSDADEESEDIVHRYTKYKEYSTRRMIKWFIGDYKIEANLHPTECKFVNAVIAKVKWMLDSVPRN